MSPYILAGAGSSLAPSFLWRRSPDNASDVATTLSRQWANPADISTILLIIGGDIVRKAFAQGTGKPYAPVCFSFGCVAYAFQALVDIIGDGGLMPPSDYPCKVMNLGSGYSRNSRNFVVGRLLRDLEAIETREAEAGEPPDYGLKISVFEATVNKRGAAEFGWSHLHVVGVAVTTLQLVISVIPWLTAGDWSVFLITLVGTLLMQWTGMLPQWTAEKLSPRQRSTSIYALTTGNGSRGVMVILGYGNCLDLEAMATPQSPRNSRPWEIFQALSEPRDGVPLDKEAVERRGSFGRQAKMWGSWPFDGLPLGFIITRLSFQVLSVLWLLFLINVSAPKSFPASWCLLAVGGIGMFQNGWLAAKEIPPEARNVPLRRVDKIVSKKVMDGIMDFHTSYGLGEPLLREFFPGDLRKEEQKWWAGDYEDYEADRMRQESRRGEPRRRQPNIYRKFIYTAARIKGLRTGTLGSMDTGKTIAEVPPSHRFSTFSRQSDSPEAAARASLAAPVDFGALKRRPSWERSERDHLNQGEITESPRILSFASSGSASKPAWAI